jgi:hypothetical protein
VRAGRGMSGMSRPAAAKEPEEALPAAPGRDVAVTATVLALTAVVFALVADHGMLAHIQRADDAGLRLMVSGRSAPVTAVAKFFNLLGLVYVTLPARIAIVGFLAVRRRWWHLAAFAAAVVQSEVLIGTLKGAHDRTRPPGSPVSTSNASFPRGTPSPPRSPGGLADAAVGVAMRAGLLWAKQCPWAAALGHHRGHCGSRRAWMAMSAAMGPAGRAREGVKPP